MDSMEKQTILIVDDDMNLRKILSDILKLKGYETFSVSNGSEGIDFLKETPVNLILLDLGLPDMTGLEVLSQAKAVHPYIEVIILTGNSSIDSAIEATNRGAFSYLLKPYDLEQLMLQIRRAIEKEQVEKALRRSEERYRLLAENAQDTIWALDLTGRLTYISPSVFRLRGYTPEEEMKKDLMDTMTPESAHIVRNDIEDICAKAEKGEVRGMKKLELELFHKDGRIIWAEVVANGIYDATGRIVGIQGVSRDITERKKVEAERDQLIADLQEALAKIKTLSGLLPVCSNCKKIRNDKGQWENIETYIRDHSEADFTHSVCPECMKKLYPEYVDE